MHSVGNKQVAFDNAALGFPSVKSCQAIVYHTHAGLFGYHDYKSAGGAEVDTAVAEVFGTWVGELQEAHAGDGIALYGIINRRHQYGTNPDGMGDWGAVLSTFAEKLTFGGPIYGLRIANHCDKDDSVYIECQVQNDQCMVKYKRWSKMALDMTTEGTEDEHGHIRKTSAYGEAPAFEFEALSNTEFQSNYPVVRPDGKAFNLNLFPAKKYHRFR